MDLIGIENEAEFFPSGTLSEVLKDELRDIMSRWAGLEKWSHPVERLARTASPTVEKFRQIRNASDRTQQEELIREVHHEIISALGYVRQPDTAHTALRGNPVIPLVGRVANASGRDSLWILEATITDVKDEASDPLGYRFTEEQFPDDVRDEAILDRSIEEMLSEGVFQLSDSPGHVLVLGLSQLVLVDKRKWPARSVLRFDLQEIFARKDRDTFTLMACLISREARVPEQGVPIADRLEEEAQRNANAVTTSLKQTVRDAIELLGQEVLDVADGKYPSNFPVPSRRGVWIDGPELARECLRYMYRLLFLFYAEANPRLKLLDLKNPIYASGYSLEALRELESVPLRTISDREGTFLWDSLQQTLGLLYSGQDLIDENEGTGLRLPAVKVSLFDPESTPLLNGLHLRNEAIQKVIRLLSLRSTGTRTGRISYAKLGIGQLGAVYETLISFTGVVAKTDLIELKSSKGNPTGTDADGDDNTSEAEDAPHEDAVASAEPEDKVFRRDKVDKLAPSWFVARSRIGDFVLERIVFNGSEARVYRKGTFIYRLAGRDREKSASYYTPEPLARLLIKHALMERCRGLTADKLLDLKILEPAMGSAAFLVETTNQLADLYLERKQKETGHIIPQERIVTERQKVRAYIADRNCFGVDLNPIAVELGAISLWLNSLHASDFSPWFGDQLHAGNSLIGARRASYRAELLTAKRQADLWLNAKPEEIGWQRRLPEGHVWQWLLPAKDMANFDKDKSITPFAKDAQNRIKTWRKTGFFKKLEPHEINLAQRLSLIAEKLFDQVAMDLERTRAATNDEIEIWPDKVMVGNRRLDFHEKARLNDHLTGADHASNTLPYKRLKTAMDAWSALWLWPLDKTDLLPERAEFLQGMAMILEGGFTADGALAAPSAAEFVDPAPDFLEVLDPDTPAPNLFRAADIREDRLFRETNVEALIDAFDWLKIAIEVAERERFVHFDLIFADVMKTRRGFDLIVGNPPWMRPSWNEGVALADIDPLYAGLSATAARKILPLALPTAPSVQRRGRLMSAQQALLHDFVSTRGATQVSSSSVMNPFAGSGANNLYCCVVDLSFRLVADDGYVALIHQDGHLTGPKSVDFRRSWYKRIVKHFHFRNEISAKNFSEVGHGVEFSLNVYRGEPSSVNFDNFVHAFVASQIDDSYGHDGVGEVPGFKDPGGCWETRGHLERIVQIDDEQLTAMARVVEGDASPTLDTKFFQPLSRSLLMLYRTLLSKHESLVQSGITWACDSVWNETSAQKKLNVIERRSNHPTAPSELIYSSPMIMVGNPLYKAPKEGCFTNLDYSSVNLCEIGDDFLPRSNFSITNHERYNELLPRLSWNDHQKHTDEFRIAYRERTNPHGERTLICAIVTPGTGHVNSIESVAFESELDLLTASTLWVSIPYDFMMKFSGSRHVYQSLLGAFPWLELDCTALNRGLRLACVTCAYSDLWNRRSHNAGRVLPWSSLDPRLSHEGLVGGPDIWERGAGLRTEFARRMALVEIDVLVAQALGLTLDQLIEIYRVYFPVLQENEAGTWYDQNGRIVWTCSKALPGIGYLENGKRPGRKAWEKILGSNPSNLTCTSIDDTRHGGPCAVTRNFVAPFTYVDRIEDYRRAWGHFQRLRPRRDHLR